LSFLFGFFLQNILRRRLRAPAAAASTALLTGCACLPEQNAQYEPGLNQAQKAPSQGPLKKIKYVERPKKTAPSVKQLDAQLVKKPAPPDCRVQDGVTPSEAEGAPAADVDPNLVEIARVQLERDCYKDAEQEVRRRLISLQREVAPGNQSGIVK
jgi:hypothetical protein